MMPVWKVFYVILIVLLLASCKPQYLLPIEENGKYGYINERGKVKVQCKYDFASSYRNGYAVVCTTLFNKNGIAVDSTSYSIIDLKGNLITKFSWAGPFLSMNNADNPKIFDLAVYDYKIFVIPKKDTIPDILIYTDTPDDWEKALPDWLEKMPNVRKISLNCYSQDVYSVYSQSIAVGSDLWTETYNRKLFHSSSYYFDRIKTDEEEDIVNRFFPVKIYDRYVKQYVDTSNFYSDFIVKYSNNLFGVLNADRRWILADSSAQTLSSPYDALGTDYINNEFVIVQLNNKYGVINSKGKIVLKANYTSIKKNPYESIIRLVANNKYGWATLDLKNVTEPVFDVVQEPHDKIIYAELDNKRGYYTISGKELIAPQYYTYTPLTPIIESNKVFCVYKSELDANADRYSYVSRRGKVIYEKK